MNNKVFTQAQCWGFICKSDAPTRCLILPQKTTESWKLQLVEDKWLLIVNNVPQMLCHPSEAVAFLKRRCPQTKTLVAEVNG